MLGDSVRRRQPKRRMSKEPGERAERGSWQRRLVTLAAVLVLPFAVGYLVAVYILFPPAEVSDGGAAVPELVGLTISEAQRELIAAGLGDMETTELPHPEIAEGTIIAQSPLPGQQLPPGADVRIGISGGRARVVVPDVLGFSAERAESMLTRAGFQVTRADQESPAPAGRVIRTDPEPGQQRTLPAAVMLIVSSGPPEVPAPGAFPDTAVIPPPDGR